MTHADYWYAVQVHGGREISIVEEIEKALGGVGAAYCPIVVQNKKITRHRRVARVDVEVPLFSKYVFVKFGSSFQNWGLVTSLKYVDGFIRANGYPLPIRSAAIERIRSDVLTGAFNDNGEGAIKVGDKIRVALHEDSHGNFSLWGGHQGIFRGLSRDHTGVVELSLFGRSTRVEIPSELLEMIL